MKRLRKRALATILAAVTVLSGSMGTWNSWGAKEAEAATFDTSLSAQDIVKALGNGWNLGDTMDCYDTSQTGGEIPVTNWGSAEPTQETFNAVKAYGFDSVRIPVSWSAHLTAASVGTGTPDIEDAWLAEVKNVVDMALNAKLYVVLNIHHPFEKGDTQGTWLDPRSSNLEKAKQYGSTMWTEIGNYFKDYDHRLVFETVNEVRDKVTLGYEDWGGNAQLYTNTNALNTACLNAIRATGGNNVQRMVLLPTYAHSMGYEQVQAWQAPTTLACGKAVGRIGIAVHAYEPNSFAYTPSDKANSTDLFTDTATIDLIMTRMTNKGVPFVITEWGSLNKSNTLERAKHANYYVNACLKAGGSLMWWDNSIFVESQWKTETFGLINRRAWADNSLTTPLPMLLGAMKESAIGFSDIYIDEATASTEAAGATVAVTADETTGLNYINLSASGWSAPRILSDSTLDWLDYKSDGILKFAYKIPSGGLTSLTLRLHDQQSNYNTGIQTAQVTGLIADGKWHECSVSLSKFGTWAGTTANPNETGTFDFSKVKGVGFELNSGNKIAVNQIRMEYHDTERHISIWEKGNVPSGYLLESKTGTVETDASGEKYISCKSFSDKGVPYFVRIQGVDTKNARFNLANAYERGALLTMKLRVASGTDPVKVDFCIGDNTYYDAYTYHTVTARDSFNNTEWADVSIPLSDFTGITDWSKISAIGLRYNTVGSTYGVDGTLHAKDIKIVWEEEEEVIQSVDLSWGDMQFDYNTTKSTWSVASGKTNTISIKNNASASVSADFAFTPVSTQTSIGSGKFTKGNAELTSVQIDSAETQTINFMPTGSLASTATNYTKIGNITVTLSKSTEANKLVCLTFDDGPSTTTMGKVLEKLNNHNAKATFFVVGDRINENTKGVLKQAVDAGHEIGNHSMSHQSMGDGTSYTATAISNDIIAAQDAIKAAAGVTPLYFRPPNLSVSDDLFNKVKELGMPIVTMSTDTVDYSATSAQQIYDKFVEGAKDGAIILQHCYEGNNLTVEALEMILTWCDANGYKAVTVSEMFAAKGITPKAGLVYRSSTQIDQSGLYN